MEFWVWASRNQDSRVQGLGFGLPGFTVEGFGFWGLGFWGLGFGIPGFRVEGLITGNPETPKSLN